MPPRGSTDRVVVDCPRCAARRRRPSGPGPACPDWRPTRRAAGRVRDRGSTESRRLGKMEDAEELVVRDEPGPARVKGVPAPVPEQSPVGSPRREQPLGRAALEIGAVQGILFEHAWCRPTRSAAASESAPIAITAPRRRPSQSRQRCSHHAQRRLDAAQREVQNEGYGRQQVARLGVGEQEERGSAGQPPGPRGRERRAPAGARGRAGSQRRPAAGSEATASPPSSSRSRARTRLGPPRRRTSSGGGGASRRRARRRPIRR